MSDDNSPKTRRDLLLPGLLLLVPAGLFAWLMLRGPEPVAEPIARQSDTPTQDTAPSSLPPATTAPSSSAKAVVAPIALPAPSVPPPTDDLLIMPGDPNAPRPDGGPLHPHPITPQHERIFRENNLIGQLYGAMDVKDGAGVRKLANEYRKEYPEDPSQLQQGYDIIADCLEHPGPESTAAGRRYFDEERGSTLRRFVARHCFGTDL